MNKTILSVILLVLTASVGPSVYGQDNRSCSDSDRKAYDGRIQRVTGKVTVLNRSKEKLPAAGMYLIFRREGCENCFVATKSDLEGNYELFLGIGRYKLIVQDGRCQYDGSGCDCYSMLSAKQPEFL